MKEFIRKNPVKMILLVNFLSVIIIFLCTEIFLVVFFPSYTVATIGHPYSSNSTKYGWGYNPYELIRIADPDTGEIYDSLVNNHGWRDIDRDFTNNKNSYRILVLGDSHTFGAIVPADKVYTRILEEKLNSEGFNVEVINIAYGRWGTDQQLEALINEGLKYKPNLVISQFTPINDLGDNLFFLTSGMKCSKPFYYNLENGDLVRHENHCFFRRKLTLREKIRPIMSKSEILKRSYGFYVNLRMRKDKRKISINSIKQLQTVLNLEEDSAFLRYIRNLGDKVNKKELVKAINLYKQRNNKEVILRLLEGISFFRSFHWREEDYLLKYPNIDGLNWKLYFSLIKKMSNLLKEHNIKLAIISDNEIGFYEWLVYWYMIKNNEESKKNFLARTKAVKEFAIRNGIGFIENKYKHTRARNDAHPNIEGNYAMSENIYTYLMKNHKEEILSYSKPIQTR